MVVLLAGTAVSDLIDRFTDPETVADEIVTAD
jgi:hypothetical protein